ncbi:MAG: hypothetical protein GWO81_07570 [Verrucomicrobia bacterium]|nr:hypothetical protein [Verrucomicrobiota bacterium]
MPTLTGSVSAAGRANAALCALTIFDVRVSIHPLVAVHCPCTGGADARRAQATADSSILVAAHLCKSWRASATANSRVLIESTVSPYLPLLCGIIACDTAGAERWQRTIS